MPKTKILIIEDDPLLIKMYQTKFVIEGFDVEVAGDGQEGLEVLQASKPDFIIMDLMMPHISGLELLERLSVSPAYKDVGVLMLTNMNRDEEKKRAMDLGARDFLLKADFTPSQIVEKVKGYLGQ